MVIAGLMKGFKSCDALRGKNASASLSAKRWDVPQMASGEHERLSSIKYLA